jgi:hypothetical protein
MSQFKYTLPSGDTYTVDAPAGTTQTDADFIFYTQVASGALVGFVPGQSVGGIQSTATKFALSRLDRGTAGVDDRAILAIVNGITTVSDIPSLLNVPLENPITPADFVNISADNTFSPTAIGPLDANQVQALMAQLANFVGQPADIISASTGIGIYGLFCEQLEQAGYVKPSTYLQFIASSPENFVSTMNSPSIWTGLNGIFGLDEFLGSPFNQNSAQLTLMQRGYDSLTAVGVITPPSTRSVSAVQGFVYTGAGVAQV